MQPLPNIADRYEGLEILGEGAFARTLRARDRETGRTVAVKVLHPSRMASAKDFDRFEREAAALARLNHVAIPTYVDHFDTTIDGERVYCIVQEFKSGRDLERLLAAGTRWNEQEIIDLALQVLEVLDHLADQDPPIVHRDIKPANLILDENNGLHLVDFGAVREAVRQTIRAGSTVIGTFGFMPPEQLMGEATHASDLFALGVTLVSLLARKPAHSLSSDGFTIPIHSLDLGVSSHLRDVLRALIAPRLDERYRDAAEVRADLKLIRDGRKPTHLGQLDLAIARRRKAEDRQRARNLRRGSRALYWTLVGLVSATFLGAFAVGLHAVLDTAATAGDEPSPVVLALGALCIVGLLGSLVGLGGRYTMTVWEPPALNWPEVIARVRDHLRYNMKDDTTHTAELVWSDHDGREVRQTYLFNRFDEREMQRFAVGQRLRLAYEPGQPAHFRIELSPADATLPARRASTPEKR